MADEEPPTSRKRVAGTQINKDNPESDDDGPEPEMGTFKKASEELMATRRIVKVRHQQRQPSAPSSNPFAAIKFTPSDSSVQTSAPVPEPKPSYVTADEGSNGSGKDVSFVPNKNADAGEVPGIQKDESAAKTDSDEAKAPSQPVEANEKAEDTKDGSGEDKSVAEEPKGGNNVSSEVEDKTKEGDAEEPKEGNSVSSKFEDKTKEGAAEEPKEGNSVPSDVEDKTKEGDAEEKKGADEAGSEDKISKDDTVKKDGGELETKDGLSDLQNVSAVEPPVPNELQYEYAAKESGGKRTRKKSSRWIGPEWVA